MPKKKSKPRKRPAKDEFDGKLYTVGKWKGLDNYECLFCAFATVDRADALQHAAAEHGPPPEPPAKMIDTGLVTEDGSPITRVEKDPAEEA